MLDENTINYLTTYCEIAGPIKAIKVDTHRERIFVTLPVWVGNQEGVPRQDITACFEYTLWDDDVGIDYGPAAQWFSSDMLNEIYQTLCDTLY